LLPLSRSWFKGILLEAHWPYRRGQVTETLAQRLRFTVACLHHGRRFALVHATGEKHRRSVRAD
ncbi:hypothetical protein, partial [Burkholderia pseudomallei]|uniref:hypothetical protein n=1 Tax=Burkholderia pseudomallei TaxID=28450 RepID=UPI001C4D1CC2